MNFGYVRVSSQDQNTNRQLDIMKELGLTREGEDLFIDKKSGKDFNREGYKTLRTKLREGDTLFVDSLDRFGRDMDEIRKEWQQITEITKADIVVLDKPELLDTRQWKAGGLDGKFISGLFLHVMSYLAQKEREKTRERQRQGIDSAKMHGTKTGKPFGRPRAPIPDGFKVAYRAWKAAEISAVQAMKISGMKKTTFYRIVREWEEEQANEPTNRKAVKHQKP